jgi:GNAT-like C-terminal domain/N-acyltransferase N-terminal domain
VVAPVLPAPPAGPIDLPDDAAARDLLARLRVPDAVFDEILAARPVTGSPAWVRLQEMHRELVTQAKPLCWAPVPADAAPTEWWLALWSFLATMPHALALDAARGVPEDLTWHTLSDLGNHVAGRLMAGRPGFDPFWFSYHLRGRIYRLGRLQFNVGRATIDSGPDAPFVPGDPVLGIHVPMDGPLSPAAVDDALSRGREFFPRHVSDRHLPIGTCRSWLLDPQLAEFLPADSNIVRFQRRFALVDGWSMPGDNAVLHYVFGLQHADPGELVPTSTLQWAIRDRLLRGKHFVIRRGWLRL